MRKEQGDLHKEVEELRKQNEQLRAEKDEAGQALAKVLETVQATNQIAQKLGVTKSPFARRAEAPAAAPNPTPHEYRASRFDVPAAGPCALPADRRLRVLPQ